MNELNYGLHDARSLRFCCVPFDEGLDIKRVPSLLYIWTIRSFSIGLFILNIFVDFSIGNDAGGDELSGQGGYETWADHPKSSAIALSQIPIIFLSCWSIAMTFIMYRYGKSMTISLVNNRRWRIPLVCAIFYAISNIFNESIYAVVSNAGEIVLLLGTSFGVFMVQNDLNVASSFADFLYRSNAAFQSARNVLSREGEGGMGDDTEDGEDGGNKRGAGKGGKEIELTAIA